ncbi:MAG: PAS domain-containing protein [Deltaproteobacteria bacterium]|nr:PAS domain-containing protein [Deltaproteobacteria bacterium]
MNCLADAVVLIDTGGQLTLVNPAAEQLLGRAQAQLLGRPCAEVFRPTPAVAQMVERTLASGQTQARSEDLRPERARNVPVRLHTSAIWDEHHGRIRGVVLTIHDLSYQRTLEEDARRREHVAQLSTLVAGVAHEVKNPLGGIKGAAQLLAQRLGDRPDLREYTAVIERETNRLSQMVDELLLLGAPRPSELAPLNIHKVIQEVLALLQPELAAGGINRREEFDPSLPAARGDAAQLTQVLLNLMKNAIEAMRGAPAGAGHCLTVVTRMETDFHLMRDQDGSGQLLRIEIGDSGPGLTAAARARLFEPFYSTKPRGTGLGLAICQRLMAAQGGSLRVDNAARGGAVATLNLPLAR